MDGGWEVKKRKTLTERASHYAKHNAESATVVPYSITLRAYLAGYRAAQRDARKKGKK